MYALLILGSGKGERLGLKIPKPFCVIDTAKSTTILSRTMKQFNDIFRNENIDIFCTARDLDEFNRCLKECAPKIVSLKDKQYIWDCRYLTPITFNDTSISYHKHSAGNDLIQALKFIDIRCSIKQYKKIFVISGDSILSNSDLISYIHSSIYTDNLTVGIKYNASDNKKRISGIIRSEFGNVKEFYEKPTEDQVKTEDLNLYGLSCSLYSFTQRTMVKIISSATDEDKLQLGSTVINSSLLADGSVNCLPINSWVDINTIEDLIRVHDIFDCNY